MEPSMALEEDIRRLAEQERLLVFSRFGPEEAWALGNVVRGVPMDANHEFFLPLWTNFLPGKDAGILDIRSGGVETRVARSEGDLSASG